MFFLYSLPFYEWLSNISLASWPRFEGLSSVWLGFGSGQAVVGGQRVARNVPDLPCMRLGKVAHVLARC